MFIQASQLLGKPLVATDEPGRFGSVRDLVVDPTNGRILALAVQPPGWFAQRRYLATQDILGFGRGDIVIHGPEALAARQELIRVDQALAARITILKQAALTESGQPLGNVDDVLIDLTAWLIAKYYLKHLLAERILPASEVHSITSQAVVFFDRVAEPGPAAARTEIVAA